MIKDSLIDPDPFIGGILRFYQTCTLGTGGMGFNWPNGKWEDTPLFLVEACEIVAGTIAEHFSDQQRQQQIQVAALQNASRLRN